MLAAPQDNYLASRNEALHNVESAIRDIGGIFQQLAHMVSGLQPYIFVHMPLCCTTVTHSQAQSSNVVLQVEEQGELAIRIDENVDETLGNVDNAQTQLLKYLNSISSNRWLIMKIFFVLMVFMMIFVVFVA